MGYISPTKPAATCVGCYAWGVLPGRYCRACYTFGQLHQIGECASCHRQVPIKKGYCRLCWLQASLQAKDQVTVLDTFLRKLTCQQLFLSNMHRQRSKGPGPRIGRQGRRRRRPQPPPAEPETSPHRWTQLRMPITVRRDYTRFDRRQHADPANPALRSARAAAAALAEARGWTRWIISDVDRALVMLLSTHTADDMIRFSELFPKLRHHDLSVGRTVEVLARIGLLDDDRIPTFDRWLAGKLSGIAPGIAADVEAWARLLHEGGPRQRARSIQTVWSYLTEIRPILLDWSRTYDHLREVTRDDIVTIKDTLQGAKRENTVVALRSLMRFCRKTGRIFRDPTIRLRIARRPEKVILPLTPGDIDHAVATATTPAIRLILALAAVHAARPKMIRDLRLDDVDLGNHRVTIGGHPRPLDELTRQALLAWLDYRRSRWPSTANPHLLLTQQTAMETSPVGKLWVTHAVRGLTATLERLRVDRQLEEALTRGPDPLHLATVFGIDDKTAIRYANAARHLLESTPETPEPA
ncbi:tyrosine-type recombinase/integrase [Streptosporangium sp. G11]|uniref:tyrosine-type recombinase/integrase n=1 Tax=Streptosporangium sp. G11 TaxID=3436926 RepID=UPI003EB8D827